jgi:hypothetical protein
MNKFNNYTTVAQLTSKPIKTTKQGMDNTEILIVSIAVVGTAVIAFLFFEAGMEHMGYQYKLANMESQNQTLRNTLINCPHNLYRKTANG